MDVHIEEVNSTVRVMDSDSLLTQRVIDQIARALLPRVKEDFAHEARVADESKLRASVFSRDSTA